jgi:hypothetical protein
MAPEEVPGLHPAASFKLDLFNPKNPFARADAEALL